MNKDRRGGDGGIPYDPSGAVIRTKKETAERKAQNDAEFRNLSDMMQRDYGWTLNQNLRDSLDWRAARESAYGVMQILKSYPEARELLKGGNLAATGMRHLSTLAYADLSSGAIRVNDVWYRDRETLDLIMQNSGGFHPTGGRSIGVTTHEAGHLLVTALARKMGTGNYDAVAKTITDRALKMPAVQNYMKKNLGGRNRTAQMAGTISRYAHKNNHETIAEGISDYAQRGSQANVYSRAIHHVIRQMLRE